MRYMLINTKVKVKFKGNSKEVAQVIIGISFKSRRPEFETWQSLGIRPQELPAEEINRGARKLTQTTLTSKPKQNKRLEWVTCTELSRILSMQYEIGRNQKAWKLTATQIQNLIVYTFDGKLVWH